MGRVLTNSGVSGFAARLGSEDRGRLDQYLVAPAVPEIGIKQTRHSLSHHNGNPVLLEELAQSDVFNVEQFGYFLGRLAEVRDAEGPLLDTTVAVCGSAKSYGHSHGMTSVPVAAASSRHSRFRRENVDLAATV